LGADDGLVGLSRRVLANTERITAELQDAKRRIATLEAELKAARSPPTQAEAKARARDAPAVLHLEEWDKWPPGAGAAVPVVHACAVCGGEIVIRREFIAGAALDYIVVHDACFEGLRKEARAMARRLEGMR